MLYVDLRHCSGMLRASPAGAEKRLTCGPGFTAAAHLASKKQPINLNHNKTKPSKAQDRSNIAAKAIVHDAVLTTVAWFLAGLSFSPSQLSGGTGFHLQCPPMSWGKGM